MATKEASSAVSRELGSLPCSMVSRTFFSVASSVLESLSGASAIQRPKSGGVGARLRRRQLEGALARQPDGGGRHRLAGLRDSGGGNAVGLLREFGFDHA